MLVTVEIKIFVDMQALWCPGKWWAIPDSAGSKPGTRQHKKKKLTSQQNRTTSVSEHNENKLKESKIL